MGIRRPRYADIASTLALVIALSTGGAYAAHKIHTSDIANSAVNSNKIKDGQIGFKDLGHGVRDSAVPPWGTVPSGKTVTGVLFEIWVSGAVAGAHKQHVDFPALAPTTPKGVGFGDDDFPETSRDPSCMGTATHPTAPKGHVCIYLESLDNVSSTQASPFETRAERTHAFYLGFLENENSKFSDYQGVWAYSAP